jgi:hypothetical protein
MTSVVVNILFPDFRLVMGSRNCAQARALLKSHDHAWRSVSHSPFTRMETMTILHSGLSLRTPSVIEVAANSHDYSPLRIIMPCPSGWKIKDSLVHPLQRYCSAERIGSTSSFKTKKSFGQLRAIKTLVRTACFEVPKFDRPLLEGNVCPPSCHIRDIV